MARRSVKVAAAVVPGFALVLCLAGVMTLCGCGLILLGGAAAAGAGAVVYVKGNIEQTVNAPVSKVHDAAIKTVKEIDIPIMQNKSDTIANTVHIESEYLDGTHVWIDLAQVTNESTKITVRVGTMGDEARSRDLINRITKNAGL